MKKLVSFLLCLLMLTAIVFPARASETALDPVVDEADLLTPEEEAKLEDTIRQIFQEQGIFSAILTVNSLSGKTAEAYADDYYDQHYYPTCRDGVLLLIAMDTREWAISTCGRAIDLLTDYELDQVFYSMADELGDNQFYDAFEIYLLRLPQYMAVAPETEPGFGDFLRILVISLLIGAAAGGITILVMRGQMNTAKPQHSAGEYLVDGSYQLKKHLDIFLYSRVTRTKKPDTTSTHRSSGGVRHGGRSGRF